MTDSPTVQYQKLSSTDAFILFDLDDVPAVGTTRLARKILRDGAELLARSTTYTFASFGIRMAGGSAGINAEGDDRDPAVASYVDEVKELVASGRWATDPGLGLTEADLAPLRIEDKRPQELWTSDLAATLTASGAVSAAGALGEGDLGGVTCGVAGSGPAVDALGTAVADAGGSLVEGGPDVDCDVLFLAGRAGMLDHEAAEGVRAKTIVPLTPVPITARAHAVLAQSGRIHVPDFLSIAGPLLHAHGSGDGAPADQIASVVGELAGAGAGLWMAAIERAEAFLRSWAEALPFGRPLA